MIPPSTEEIEACLRERPNVVVEIEPMAAMMLISNLQIALRHPDNTGNVAKLGRDFIAKLRSRLVTSGDALDIVIAMGFDPAYDSKEKGN